jgi:hypothetical protein
MQRKHPSDEIAEHGNVVVLVSKGLLHRASPLLAFLMWCISFLTNSPGWVEVAFPSFFLARRTVCFPAGLQITRIAALYDIRRPFTSCFKGVLFDRADFRGIPLLALVSSCLLPTITVNTRRGFPATSYQLIR